MTDFITTPDELQLITGVDIPIEGLGITVRQPKIKEISMIGEQNYFIALQIFSLDKETLNIQSKSATNWEIFQEAMKQKIDGIRDLKILVLNFLRLFFKETVNFGPRSIMIMSANNGIINIEAEDFPKFQQLIGAIGGKSLLQPSEEQFNTKSRRAAEIAEKMKKARERLAKVKAVEQGIKPDEHKKGFLKRYVKIVSIGTSNSLEQVNNMTLLQLNDLMQTCLAREAYDIEVKSRLAGAKSDKELIHWSMADQVKDDGIGRI